MRKSILAILILFSTFSQKSLAQVTPSWVHSLGDLDYNYAGQIALDKQNNLVVCYSSNSVNQNEFLIRLVKFDSARNILWSSDYSDSTSIYETELAIDSSGNIYILAKTYPKVMLLKFNSKGNFLWEKSYIPEDGTLWNFFIKISPSNNILFSFNESPKKGYDYTAVFKYDSVGNLLWQTLVRDPSQDNLSCYDFVLDANENIFLTGSVTFEDYSDIIWLKISSDGKSINEQYLDLSGTGAPEFGNSIVYDHNGFTYLTGMNAVNESGSFGDKMTVAKYDTSGNLIWLKSFPDSTINSKFYNGWKILIGPNKTIYALGSYASDTARNNKDFLVLNYDTAGNLLWNKIYYIPPDQYGFEYYEPTNFIAANNCFYACAPPQVCEVDGNHISVAVFDESGSLKMLDTYNPSTGSCIYCRDFTVDKKGNIYTLDNIYGSSGAQLFLIEFSKIVTGMPTQPTNQSFSVYPTINNGDFVINATNDNLLGKQAGLKVLDVAGTVVYSMPLNFNNKSVNIPVHLPDQFPSGTYFVRITSTIFNSTAKMIVSK
jgi:hypothetical protein